jgi:hypothetical protein
MVFCPMRILPCEPGMHACDRPLHAWFHIEERARRSDHKASLFDMEDGTHVFLSLSDCTTHPAKLHCQTSR